MKKTFLGFGAVLLLCGLAPNDGMAEGNLNLMINGSMVNSDVPPQLINGHSLVPIRIISEKLGTTTSYDDLYKSISVTGDKSLIKFVVGQSFGFVNTQKVEMDQPAEIIQNRTFVPLRFVAESLGVTVGWNQVNQTVFVNDKYSINVNGENMPGEKVFIVGNDLYISLPDLSAKLNVQVKPGSTPTNATVNFNGKSWNIDAASSPNDTNWQALALDNSIYVPVTQISKNLNATVNVDQNNKRVSISSYQATINTSAPIQQIANTNSLSNNLQSARSLNSFPGGTFLFIWKAEHINSGDIPSMIARAKQLGVTGVIIKFANGSLAGDANSQHYMDQYKKLVDPFKKSGLKVGGWIYQYLTDVDGEVDACSQAIQAGADFIVLDAEGDVAGKGDQVTQFGQKLRAKYPKIPVGLSSYAFADLHANDVPFDQYNQFVDAMMPQIYWADMGKTVDQAFTSSVNSYKRFNKPINPTGQLYNAAQPTEISQFNLLSHKANYNNISWWDWDEATDNQLKSIQNSFLFALN